MRFLLPAFTLTAFLAASLSTNTQADVSLGIGSKAPALDIEHYVSDGEGYFGEVTKFEEGKVYMVEFWATWCGPCIQSMPHLVELQNQYRGEGFQVVSISDESLEEVETLLEKDYPDPDVGKTFGELTSAYTLTVDTDGSVSEDYMLAAGRNGIPAAFLVGKTGLVEWIGHPMSADEPLAMIMSDSWDREAFKEQMRREELIQTARQKINQLAGTGQFDDAIKVVDMTIAEFKDATDPVTLGLIERLKNLRYNLRLDSGDLSDDVLQFFRDQLASIEGKPIEIIQFAYGMISSMQQGTEIGPLTEDTLTALKGAAQAENVDPQIKPLAYVLMAQLHAANQAFDEAIAAQEKAVETSSGVQQERMQEMLGELKRLAGVDPEPESDDEPQPSGDDE
ncbi:MAG: TlpA disulfide reductase family protein [Planctomycetota bacterium]